MFDFFKKKTKPADTAREQPKFAEATPPEGDDTRRNIAIGELRDGLIQVLQNEHGVHAETLMAVIGAIAGCAIANVVHRKVAAGEARLMTIGLEGGSVAYMGDDLNAYLAPEDPNITSLWSLAAAGALEAGAVADKLPDLGALFGGAVGRIGRAEYDSFESYGSNRPGVDLRGAIEGWGFAKKIFTRESPIFAGKVLGPEQWPFVAGAVAQAYIIMTKDILDPALALQLVMDSAIRASKLDPKTFP